MSNENGYQVQPDLCELPFRACAMSGRGVSIDVGSGDGVYQAELCDELSGIREETPRAFVTYSCTH